MRLRQIVLLLLLALAIGAFVALDLGHFLSFDQLKASQASFAQLHAEQPLTVAAVYFLIYVLATALSIPGAVVITLAGGAIFGLWQGLLIVSFASTVGATLAFLASRFLLRDWVEARFGQRLADINAGVNREGGFYLFTLRLIPVVPFFLINLLMGLTRMKAWTYYWVSQLGMLAGTAMYVNAGTQLAQLDSVKGILSPALLGSFVLLGIFPLIARRIVAAVQKRKVYARWADQRPKTFDRNLIVIGGGAGGLVSAYIAAAVKAKVTLIEAHKMGGDCLNYGCVPSKALIKSAKLAHQMRHASNYGLSDAAPSPPLCAAPARLGRCGLCDQRHAVGRVRPTRRSAQTFGGAGRWADWLRAGSKLCKTGLASHPSGNGRTPHGARRRGSERTRQSFTQGRRRTSAHRVQSAALRDGEWRKDVGGGTRWRRTTHRV